MTVSSDSIRRLAAYIDTFVAPGNGLNGPTAAIFGPDFNDDENGDLYVASFNTDSILVYDGLNGAFLDVFVTVGSGGLNGPDAGMNFGPDGNLYVPSFWSHAVLRYDGGEGAFIDAFVSPGEGGLAWPRVVLFREDGRVIVSAEASDQVLLYDGQDGTPLGALIDDITTPTGMAIRDGMLYVASNDADSVSRYDVMTGDFIDTVVANGDSGLDAPTFVAFTQPPPVIPGDLDGDGVVGPADLIQLLGQWGACDDCASCSGDLDDDCVVGTSDLILLLGNWS